MNILKKSVLKISMSISLAVIVIVLSLSNTSVFAQHDHSQHKKESKKVQNMESIVREGEIDLKKIDKNKDGKVFQDQMDWNVISDKAGKCPLCKMTLKEVTIKTAKDNLIKHGFKVK